jgi:hypothetical protein
MSTVLRPHAHDQRTDSSERAGSGAPSPARLRRLLRGGQEDPWWSRPGLFAVLARATLLIGWGLTRSGMSNEYYAAAVKSGTVSWKAWYFGSIDPGSLVTVDKPPLSLWLMGLSGGLLGFSSFSMFLPDAICGVVAVGCCTRRSGVSSGTAPRCWPRSLSPSPQY